MDVFGRENFHMLFLSSSSILLGSPDFVSEVDCLKAISRVVYEWCHSLIVVGEEGKED